MAGLGKPLRVLSFGLALASAAIVPSVLNAKKAEGHRVDPARPSYAPTAADRAVAFGLLIDSPRPLAVIDEAIVLAEMLRRLYGIDTGNSHADRREAARRAAQDLLEKLDFDEAEIAGMARALGFSLDPKECATYCREVASLARVELEKRALRAFAEGVPLTDLLPVRGPSATPPGQPAETADQPAPATRGRGSCGARDRP